MFCDDVDRPGGRYVNEMSDEKTSNVYFQVYIDSPNSELK